MFSDVKLVIYDLDGVLINGDSNIVESFRLLYQELGEPFNSEDVRSRIGMGMDEVLREILPEKYHHDLGVLRERYLTYFQGLGVEKIKVLAGVAETLAEMKRRGVKQSVATNKDVGEAERILKALDLDRYIDLYTISGTVDKVKPEPDMIL